MLGENGRIQSWEMGDDEVVTESFVADAHLPPDAKIATWRGGALSVRYSKSSSVLTHSLAGRVIASASGDRVQVLKFRRSGQLRFITAAKSPVSMDDALTFFVVRTNEDSLSTTIVGVTSESVIRTWIYHYPSKSLTDGPSHDLGATRYTLASPVPIEPGLEVVDEVSVVLLDEEGTLHRWSTRLSEPYEGWYPDGTVKTGLKKVQAIACSWDGTSAFGASPAEFACSAPINLPALRSLARGRRPTTTLDLESKGVRIQLRRAVLASTRVRTASFSSTVPSTDDSLA